MRKIYVASSWRNGIQQRVVEALRAAGHEVYDFKNPAPGNKGFAWSEVDRDWLNWTPEEFGLKLYTSEIAAAGFKLDRDALDWCDTCVLVLPCGRSAHLEAGYASGHGKETYVLLNADKFEPELMYLLCTVCVVNIDHLLKVLEFPANEGVMQWHQLSGGSFKRPASHAVRLLREVVELCIAAGATEHEIYNAVDSEIFKGTQRAEMRHVYSVERCTEEVADCSILLELFTRYAGINRAKVVREKMSVLHGRTWEADEGGALYRPKDSGNG